MKSLQQRLDRVSAALTRSTSSKCPLCGWHKGAEIHANISFDIEMADTIDSGRADRSKDFCAKCGRPLVLRIEFDDRG
ncbi:MAG: hypothetical protein KF805_09050 [Phycisphaeraceae bacterium]|nr:hypothetical protein [Phycisphaeraceae bacterium]